jgi:6-phosphogluconolactonase
MKEHKRETVICRDLEDVSLRAAALFIQLAEKVASSAGRFTVALSGGSTPRALYALLASDQFRSQVPWPQGHFFWGDERCVPPDHFESNYRMAREALLDAVPIPTQNIHRMPGEYVDHTRAATEYEQTLKTFFEVPAGKAPRFDLILLGMGDDGHTASLFPGTAALTERERWVTDNYVEKLATHRLTLTVPVINHAANVVFLISGESKASVLRKVLEGEYQPQRLPSQFIRPEGGTLMFFVDQAAAKELTSSGAKGT